MELSVTALNVDISKDNIAEIKAKTKEVFARIHDHVISIKVILNDINGPKGGFDQQCKVIVQSRGIANIVVSNNQTSMINAVNNSLTTAKLSLLRKIKRQKF